MAKYTDMREITVTVANGDDSGYTTISHGVTDADGDAVDPDSIVAEIVDASGSSLFPATVSVSRPGTTAGVALGLTTGQVAIYINKGTNGTGSNQVYTVRVTSQYIHSIQSSDHTA